MHANQVYASMDSAGNVELPIAQPVAPPTSFASQFPILVQLNKATAKLVLQEMHAKQVYANMGSAGNVALPIARPVATPTTSFASLFPILVQLNKAMAKLVLQEMHAKQVYAKLGSAGNAALPIARPVASPTSFASLFPILVQLNKATAKLVLQEMHANQVFAQGDGVVCAPQAFIAPPSMEVIMPVMTTFILNFSRNAVQRLGKNAGSIASLNSSWTQLYQQGMRRKYVNKKLM